MGGSGCPGGSECHVDQFGDPADPDFFAQAFDLRANGVDTDAERNGDLLGRRLLHQMQQYGLLGCRQLEQFSKRRQ